MMPIAAERQPKNSLVSIVISGPDTTVLAFSEGRYVPSLCLFGLAGGIILLLACLAWFDPAGFTFKIVGKAVAIICATVFLAVAFLFGHYRLTVTPQSIVKSLRLLGVNLPADRVKFRDVTDVVCGSDTFGPVIYIHRRRDVPFFVEGFSSPEERDWIAESFRGIWQAQTQSRNG
jgi:hypothetical protein